MMLRLILVACVTAGLQTAPSLIFEHADHAHFTIENEILTLQKGSGWLRYSRVFLDFEATFEFKVASDKTDAGVVVRSGVGGSHWPNAGYRIALPARAVSDGATLLQTRRRKATIVERAAVAIRPPDEWQSVRIKADGKRVGLAINDQPAFVADIDWVGGFVLFDNRNGTVQIRNVKLTYATPANMGEPVNPESAEIKALTRQRRFEDPEPLLEVKPEYTYGAMRRKIQGTVVVQAVVLPDGTIGRTQVIDALDRELDLEALAAVRQWVFLPGRLNGRPVPTIVTVDLRFTLK